MGADERALKTVECLRGRLVAQRAASREAKENAELMDKKLKELGKQLKHETKCRRNAEKKLNLLKKKLESLNISISATNSEDSLTSSSAKSEASCTSSIASNTCFNQQEEAQPTCETSKTCLETGEQTQSKAELENKTDDFNTSEQKGLDDPLATGQQPCDGTADGFQQSVVHKSNENEKSKDCFDDIDNSMALVPERRVSCPVDQNNTRGEVIEVNTESVREVLHTLKQIKENIQSTMERRRMVKGG